MITKLQERLRTLLNEQDLSLEEFAEACELPIDTVKNIYYGRTVDPKISTIRQMAKTLNIGINCLLGECQHTTDEKILLRHFRSCGKHGQHVISLVAEFEALSAKEEREGINIHTIPLVIPRGDIIQGIIFDRNNTEQIPTTNENADVGILMINNELAPHFYKDDVVLFEKRFPGNKEYAAFYKNGRVYIREFYEEGNQYRLKPLYKGGTDLVFKRMNEIGFLGTYCGITEYKEK